MSRLLSGLILNFFVLNLQSMLIFSIFAILNPSYLTVPLLGVSHLFNYVL